MPASGSVDAAAKGVKLERYASGGALLLRRVASAKLVSASSHLLFRATVLATLALVFLFTLHYPSLLSRSFHLSSGADGGTASPMMRYASHRSLLMSSAAASYGGAAWEKEIRRSAKPRRDGGISVLVTGAAGFVGAHCSLALRARGDGVLGLDNFNSYYDPSLKRGRQRLLADRGVVVLDADINDGLLLEKLFDAVPFTHVLHLAAQAGVRYAMEAPQTYVASNVAGLVSVLEVAAKHADPQPAIVWASSSSVYGLNTDAPFSEEHRTDRPASLYAATKKAGEAIAHAYNHIYGLSITGLRFFTVYGPWGRPDMAYFFFARSIVAGEPITLFRAADGSDARRDFTYIGDVVKGCLGALDTAGKSTGSRSGKKSEPAPLRVYNLGNTSPVPVTRMVAILEKLLGKKANKHIVIWIWGKEEGIERAAVPAAAAGATAAAKMSSNFSFPMMAPAQIAEALHTYGLAPAANLRADDIANPQPDLLPSVLSFFLASVVDPLGDDLDGDDAQLGFEALEALDNPEHHAEAIRVLRLYRKARGFLDSIQFHGFTLRDLLRPDPQRVAIVLSALINFLFYRDEKLGLLQPIVNEFPNSDERRMELKAKIAEHQKAIADHELAAQMEEPMVQQLEAEVNALKQKIQEYNKQQMALRGKAKAINDRKEEILSKISQADFELMKRAQENSKLLSKVVQSPEKLQRALEEKKSARAELKNSEKTAMQSVQEKTATLEMYSKAYEKLAKQFSKIQALHEQVTTAKTVEKEVKARKAKLSDESISIMALDAKIVEWQGKVHETEERLKAKEKERDQRIADENQMLGALRSEIEWKLQCLEPRERKVEATVAKAAHLCSEADSVRIASTAKQQEIHAKFEEIVQAFNYYMGTVNPFLERVEEVGKETLERLDRRAVETAEDTSPK